MINDIRASWALLIGIFFMMLGHGLQGTLLGFRATIEGIPTFVTGIIMSGYFIGIFLGSMIAPKLVGRVGHIRVFAALASVASIAILLHGLYVNAITWTAMRVITGISYAGLYVVAESWLNDQASNETRGQMLSFYMVVTTLGLGAGQFLLNFGDPQKVELFILVSVIVSFGLIPILLTAKAAPAFSSTQRMSLSTLYKASPLAVISNGLTGAAHGTIFGLGAVYASTILQEIKLVSLFMSCFLFGGMATQWPIGWIADRVNRRLVIAIVSAVAVVASIAVILAPVGSIFYFIMVFALGGAGIPMYSLTIAYANDRLEPDQFVSASACMVMVSGIGLSTGPIVISYFMGTFGAEFFFYGIAILFASIVGFCAYRMRVAKATDTAQQSPSVSVCAMGTPVAEYNAPDAEKYVDALVNNELERLDKEVNEEPQQV